MAYSEDFKATLSYTVTLTSLCCCGALLHGYLTTQSKRLSHACNPCTYYYFLLSEKIATAVLLCFVLLFNSWDFTVSHYKWFTCTNPERFIYYAPSSLNRFHNHKYHEVPLAKWKDFLLFFSSLRIEIQILPWLTFLLILKLCSLGILVVSEENSFKNNFCRPVPWY